MLLKLVYGISLIVTNNDLIKINIVFFNFISFMSFVFGMFFDSLQVIKNKNFMQEELSAFFNLIEFDYNSEVIFMQMKNIELREYYTKIYKVKIIMSQKNKLKNF